jgi:catechol 2,3-dioxygenase-like lactoylglutathione lyase family enzyme
MSVQFNHTIAHAKDPEAAARFVCDLFGLPDPVRFPPFWDVDLANGVTLAYIGAGDYDFQSQHYAFLVSEDDFDQIFGRIKERGMQYWADPHKNEEGAINHHFGGRGVYFNDLDGNWFEIITTPYDTGA